MQLSHIYNSAAHVITTSTQNWGRINLFSRFSENEYTEVDPLFQNSGRTSEDLSFDIGMLFKATDNFALGVAIQNLNEPNLALEGGAESSLPREITGGLSFKLGKVQPSLDFSWRNADIRGEKDVNLHLGLETWPLRDVGIRGGINLYELAAGASYRIHRPGGEFRLDYAFNYPLPFELDLFNRGQESLSGTSGTHQFAIAVRFSDFLQLVNAEESDRRPKPKARVEVVGTSDEYTAEEMEAAAANYQQVLKRDNSDVDAHYGLAQIYTRKGHYDAAIEHLDRAVALAPDNPQYHYTLALVYEEYGDTTGRKMWYNKAIIELERIRIIDLGYRDVSTKVAVISKKNR